MTTASLIRAKETVSIAIGGMTIGVHTRDSSFQRMIEDRYMGFLETSAPSHFDFDVELYEPSESSPADDALEVRFPCTMESG